MSHIIDFNGTPAPEQRVRDFLDVTEEHGDVIAYSGPHELASSDIRDVVKELESYRAAHERATDAKLTDLDVSWEADALGAYVYLAVLSPVDDVEPDAHITLSDADAMELGARLMGAGRKASASFRNATKGE